MKPRCPVRKVVFRPDLLDRTLKDVRYADAHVVPSAAKGYSDRAWSEAELDRQRFESAICLANRSLQVFWVEVFLRLQ
jgi:hypothetical protein